MDKAFSLCVIIAMTVAPSRNDRMLQRLGHDWVSGELFPKSKNRENHAGYIFLRVDSSAPNM